MLVVAVLLGRGCRVVRGRAAGALRYGAVWLSGVGVGQQLCLELCVCLFVIVFLYLFLLTWVVWAQSDSLKLQPLSSSCSVTELCCFGNHVLPSRYERAVFLMFPA